MSYTVEIRGMDDVVRAVGALPRRSRRALFRAMTRAANRAVTYAKLQLYPGHGLVTGNLRRSLHFDADRAHDEVVIGTNVEYAPFVEGPPLGRLRKTTTGFRGYRYLYNAARRLPDWVQAELEEALRRLTR